MKAFRKQLGRINWVAVTPWFLSVMLLVLVSWATNDGKIRIQESTTKQATWSDAQLDDILTDLAGDFVELAGGDNGRQTVETDQATTTSITLDNTNATGNAYLRVNSQAVSADLYTDSATDKGGVRVQTATSVANTYGIGANTLTQTWKSIGYNPAIFSADQITSNQNNWTVPTTDYWNEVWEVSSDAARNITGIVNPGAGNSRILTLINIGSFTISLPHQSASSTAANRFYFSTGGTVSLTTGACITLLYDTTVGFWVDQSMSLQAALLSGAVVKDGDDAPSQEITGTGNVATEFEVTNNNAGNAATALVGVNVAGASGSLTGYGSGYSDATKQSSVELLMSTGSNGFTLGNSAGDPIIHKIGSVEHYRANAQGFAWGQQTQAITAVGNTITPTASLMYLNPDGNYTLTSTPQITAGTKIGQLLYLATANGEANTVTLTDEGGAAGSTLQLAAATRVVADLNVLVLMWQGTYWLEVSFADN